MVYEVPLFIAKYAFEGAPEPCVNSYVIPFVKSAFSKFTQGEVSKAKNFDVVVPLSGSSIVVRLLYPL